MKRLTLLLLPVSLCAASGRWARVGEFEGQVQVQLQAAEPWMAAQRNLPLPESAWMRTAASSRLEIELDEGSAWRLGADSLAEMSDYARLSTGQRVTLLSLDHGLAYFTGEPEGKDALSLAVPGAQLTFHHAARVRLEAQDAWSQISVIEGTVRFSSPAAEMDLHEGQTVRVEPANAARFFLYREVTRMDLDGWNEARDKALRAPVSARQLPERYGLADLDTGGEWVHTEDLGAVWKPKTAEGWIPYQNGRWQWYDTLGYTWVSDDPWGWLPYHYGRWQRREGMGWVWAPAQKSVFQPGAVYWLLGAKFAGWGPLAPNEEWTPGGQPQQFLNANTTWAAFRQDSRTIDPAGFKDRPKEALGAAAFALALPSPAFPASRLDAVRPVLRAGSTRVVPVLTGVTYEQGLVPRPVVATKNSDPVPEPPPPVADAPVAVVTNAGAVQAPLVIVSQPPEPSPPPAEVYYPVPVYTGVVVINPPEKEAGAGRRRRDQPPPPNPPPAKPPAAQPPPLFSGAAARNESGRAETPARPLPARPVAPVESKPEPPRPSEQRRPAAPAPNDSESPRTPPAAPARSP